MIRACTAAIGSVAALGRWHSALIAQRPVNAVAVAVGAEANQRLQLGAIEAINGIVQTGLGIDAVIAGERIVDVLRPTFFLERAQDNFLIARRHMESLDDPVPERQ